MPMRVTLWGVRGSLPAPQPPEFIENRIRLLLQQFVARGATRPEDIDPFLSALPAFSRGGFGGHTSCVEVATDKASIIIDGGSGLRRLGERLVGGPCGMGRGEVHILFTHFHWDHLMGLPFFIPIFIPGNQIHMYAVQPELEKVIRTVFQKPYFPVPFEQLGAKIHFHQLEPRKTRELGDIRYTPYQLDHPDPCWGFKFEHAGKVFSYCVDTEAVRISRRDLGPDLPLYQDVDLMVFDAQYTLVESAEKVNWGHAAAPIGLDIALREGVKRILFAHHDPAASDQKIAQAEEQTRDYFEAHVRNLVAAGEKPPSIEWGFACEGMQLTV